MRCLVLAAVLVGAGCGDSSGDATDCVDGKCSHELPDDEEPCVVPRPEDSCSWAVTAAMKDGMARTGLGGFGYDSRVAALEEGRLRTIAGTELQIDVGGRVVSFAWPGKELPISLAAGDAVEVEKLDGWAVVRSASGELRVPLRAGGMGAEYGPWSLGDQLRLHQSGGSCSTGGASEVVLVVESDLGTVELHPGSYFGVHGWTVQNQGAGEFEPSMACNSVTEGMYFGGFSAWKAN